MPVTRNTPNEGGQFKKTTQSDDAQAEQVQPANNTAQVEHVQPTNNTAQVGDVQPTKNTAQAEQVQPTNNTAQVGEVQPTNNTAQVGELTPAKTGFTSGTQPSDQMAQMLLMISILLMTFDEQLKFQREQQRCQDSQLPPLEKIPEIDWTHNDGLHNCYTIWNEQWNAIFKSDYLFASDAVKVHKLYRHIGDEGQKKIKQWKLNLEELTPNKGKHSQFNQQKQSPQPNKKSHSQQNDNDEGDHKDHKDKKKFKSDDCTQCGDYRHKEGFRCPASQYKCKICSKTRHFPRMCFFRDEKQQCIQHIQIVQAHDDQTVILQMSDESFHDANEATSCKLDLIKLHPRLGVPPPRAKIITSQAN